MKSERFGAFKTGRLVQIEIRGRKDWAFIPAPLPPQWALSDKLWLLVAEARQAVGDLNGSGNRMSNPRLLLRPLQRREALRSSSLEGTYATPKELLLFEKARKEEEGGESAQENQWREVHNYYLALRQGYRWIQQGAALDRNLFCRLHRILMKGVRGESKNPGQIRQKQVHIGADARFNPPPHSQLDNCLGDFEKYLASEDSCEPLVRAFLGHYQFEAIHPFTDGNGRIGRVLLSLTIARFLGLSHPWLYLSEFFEDHRTDYINCLFRVSTEGEWDEWIELCSRGTIEQARSAIARCSALEALKKEYKKRVEGCSPRLHLIIDMLFSSPLLYITEVRDKLKVTYNTAKNDMLTLERFGIIGLFEEQPRKLYSADRILEIAYVD